MCAFPCCQCPEPPGYDPEVDDPLPKYRNKCGCPTATLECVSSQKDAILCGFSEYEDSEADPPVVASSPPKKYLKLIISGTYLKITNATSGACAGEPTLRQESATSHQRLYTPTGANCGSAAFSVLADSGSDTDYDYDIIEGECVLIDTTVTPNSYGLTGASADTTVSTVQETLDTNPTSSFSGGIMERRTQSWDLSEEDTEADSIARATPTAGTACTSIYELRTTSFSFTVRTATYSVTANNLCKGRAYEGCVRLQRREAYSGTEPEGADTEWEDIEPDTIASFTATAKEMEIETDVALPGGTVEAIGYEYRAVSAHVWPVSAGCECPTDYVAPEE